MPPLSLPTPSTLTPSTLTQTLPLYHPLLTHLSALHPTTPSLLSLDSFRHSTLPALLSTRHPLHLTKPELEKLLAWKLARGKFRPALKALIASNPPNQVEAVTSAAYALFAAHPTDWKPALKALCALRGVGPATASLLLAAAFADEVPFFADEVAAWLGVGGNGKGGKGLRYDVREFEAVWKGVREVRERLREVGGKEVGAGEVERGAWVWEWVRGDGACRGVVEGWLEGGGGGEEGEEIGMEGGGDGGVQREGDVKDEVEGDGGHGVELLGGKRKRKRGAVEVEGGGMAGPAEEEEKKGEKAVVASKEVGGELRRSGRKKASMR